jgi:hypothetical protein
MSYDTSDARLKVNTFFIYYYELTPTDGERNIRQEVGKRPFSEDL